MKRTLYCFVAILTFAFGCSKTDSIISPATTTSVCYLSSLAFEGYDGSSTVTTYTYSNNRVTALSFKDNTGVVDSKNFSYDAKGRIISVAETFTNPKGGSFEDNTLVTYDANGRVFEEIASSSKSVTTYNTAGQRVKKEFYKGSGSSFSLNYYYVFSCSSTNTNNYSTEMKYDGSDQLLYTIEFVYDSKTNPQAVIFPDYPYPANNVAKATFINPGVPAYTYIYTYTYNGSGFPLTSTDKNSSLVNSHTYSYSSCK